MRHLILACAAALAFSASASASAGTEDVATKGEAKLARMLEGRVAGKPVSCIRARDIRLEVIDKTAVVYDAGSTLYVARPSDPEALDTDDVLVVNRFGSQLCRGDPIRTVDRMAGFTKGALFLEDFVPYKKG